MTTTAVAAAEPPDDEPKVNYSGAPSGALGMTNEEFEAVRPVPLRDALRVTAALQGAAVPTTSRPLPPAVAA